MLVTLVAPESNGDEYVNEILEEERLHYGDREDPYLRDDDVLREQQRQAKLNEERLTAEKERKRQEREAAFQKELTKMNEAQKKNAQAQKKKDKAIVDSVLKAYNRGDMYGCLGMKYVEFQIPSREIKFAGLKVRIPGVTFLQISSKAVKKAYRNKSRLVHPDRNRDGRAEEAFIALEECASILSDDRQRAQYENQLKQVRNQRREKVFNGLHAGVRGSLSHGKKVFKIVRGVLGPFAFPITVLGCLLV